MTGLVLTQQEQWTLGILASQTWSEWGDDDRADTSVLFLQPFIAYALGGGQTVTLNSESTYDWEAEHWTVPLNLVYSKVFTINKQAMSFQVGGRAYLARPEGGPDWGIRTSLTFLFPAQ